MALAVFCRHCAASRSTLHTKTRMSAKAATHTVFRACLAGGVVVISKASAFLKAGSGALKVGGLLAGSGAVAVAATASGQQPEQQAAQQQRQQAAATPRLPSMAPPPRQ